MVAASELGSERVSNERERMSQSFRSSTLRRFNASMLPRCNGCAFGSMLLVTGHPSLVTPYVSEPCGSSLYERRLRRGTSA
jgi:hypothetical protein